MTDGAGTAPPGSGHGTPTDAPVRGRRAGRPRRRAAGLVIPLIAVVTGAGAGAALGYAVTNPSSTAQTLRAGATTTARAGPSTSTKPVPFSSLLTSDASGVVLIEATACANDDIGTGFLIGPNLVATAAHVVKDARVIALRTSTGAIVGHVVGVDPAADLALIRAQSKITGHIFTIAEHAASVGEPVAAVGFPQGLPIVLTPGTVTALNQSVPFNGKPLTGLTLTNAPVSGGDSGGPLLDSEGTVVGIVDHFIERTNGLGYALSPETVTPRLQSWQASPETVAEGRCTAIGPALGQDHLHGTLLSPADQQVVAVLKAYFAAINAANWAQAFSDFTPNQQSHLSQAMLASDEVTSYLFDFVLDGQIQDTGPSTKLANVSFTSIQDADKGPSGSTCDRWRLAYSMAMTPAGWAIDAIGGQGGGAPSHPCAGS